jgi:hypothetical protein
MCDSRGHPQNLDEVIEALTEIVRVSKDEGSRVGFFAAMYKRVTVQVRAGVETGFSRTVRAWRGWLPRSPLDT